VNTINLGTFEWVNLEKLACECEVRIPLVSTIPDLELRFTDELFVLHRSPGSDESLLKSLGSFLKSIGFQGEPPTQLNDISASCLQAEVDFEFLEFALTKGWVDVVTNHSLAVKHSLKYVLNADEQAIANMHEETDGQLSTNGRHYIVVGPIERAALTEAGVQKHIRRINAGFLAAQTFEKLAENFEDRKSLILEKQQAFSDQEFRDWIEAYIQIDRSFYAALEESHLPEEIDEIAFTAKYLGRSVEHYVYEVGV